MKTRLQDVSGHSEVPGWITRGIEPAPGETVESVMLYLRDAAGFDIRIKSNVPMAETWHRRVDQVSTEEQALSVLQQATAAMGCTVLRKGRALTILTMHDVKKECVPLPKWG